MFREALIKSPFRPEPVERHCNLLMVFDLFRSWFDKLTTNGINQRFFSDVPNKPVRPEPVEGQCMMPR